MHSKLSQVDICLKSALRNIGCLLMHLTFGFDGIMNSLIKLCFYVGIRITFQIPLKLPSIIYDFRERIIRKYSFKKKLKYMTMLIR